MWLDSSVKIVDGDLRHTFNHLIASHGGIMQTSTGHSTFAVTHKDTYQYLPTDINMMKKNEQWEATTIFIYRTRDMMNHVIRWLVMCSLEKDCIAPISNRFCHFADDHFRFFANCHRYDQSVVNILLNNFHNFDHKQFYIRNSTVIVIHRITNSALVKFCQ